MCGQYSLLPIHTVEVTYYSIQVEIYTRYPLGLSRVYARPLVGYTLRNDELLDTYTQSVNLMRVLIDGQQGTLRSTHTVLHH